MLLMVFKCFAWPSEQTATFPYTLRDWFRAPQVQSIYCMVCTESLYKTDTFRIERANPLLTNTILKIWSVMLTQKMYHISNIQYSEGCARVMPIFSLQYGILWSMNVVIHQYTPQKISNMTTMHQQWLASNYMSTQRQSRSKNKDPFSK